ncbi:MAG: hypothetical protein ABSG64_12360 [Solirubrobacteraceae bacterium]|jgi:hypothetical protein
MKRLLVAGAVLAAAVPLAGFGGGSSVTLRLHTKYSSSGTHIIYGTINPSQRVTVPWTNAGGGLLYIALAPKKGHDLKLVFSKAASGTAVIPAGSYTALVVITKDRWSITV